MKWIIIGLAVVGAVFLALGWYVNNTGGSADERLGAVIPWMIALLIFAIDGALLVGFIVYKAFAS